MPTIGPLELIIVLVIALLVLGPKRFPETGRSLGQAIRGSDVLLLARIAMTVGTVRFANK